MYMCIYMYIYIYTDIYIYVYRIPVISYAHTACIHKQS